VSGDDQKQGAAIFASSSYILTSHPFYTTLTTLLLHRTQELIAISQDSLGVPGVLIRQKTNSTDPSPEAARVTNIIEQVFSREISPASAADGTGGGGASSTGARAVVLFNRAEVPVNMTVAWADIGLSGSCTVRDIWAKNEFGEAKGIFEAQYTAMVPKHGVVMLRVVEA
jgi:hypothetical protein